MEYVQTTEIKIGEYAVEMAGVRAMVEALEETGSIGLETRKYVSDQEFTTVAEALDSTFETHDSHPIVDGHVTWNGSPAVDSQRAFADHIEEQACIDDGYAFNARRARADARLAEHVDAMPTGVVMAKASPFPEEAHKMFPAHVESAMYNPRLRRSTLQLFAKEFHDSVETITLSIDNSNRAIWGMVLAEVTGNQAYLHMSTDQMAETPFIMAGGSLSDLAHHIRARYDEYLAMQTGEAYYYGKISHGSARSKNSMEFMQTNDMARQVIQEHIERSEQIARALATGYVDERMMRFAQRALEQTNPDGAAMLSRSQQELLYEFLERRSLEDDAAHLLFRISQRASWAYVRFAIENQQTAIYDAYDVAASGGDSSGFVLEAGAAANYLGMAENGCGGSLGQSLFSATISQSEAGGMLSGLNQQNRFIAGPEYKFNIWGYCADCQAPPSTNQEGRINAKKQFLGPCHFCFDCDNKIRTRLGQQRLTTKAM